jgi:hypothetical protein
MTSPAYPLGPPTATGTTLTVDVALNRPEILTRRLADTTSQRYITDKVFRSTGASVAAGALVFERVLPGDNFLARDVEQRAPTSEYPVVSGPRGTPRVAKSEDWGGKFFIADESRTRNDSRLLDDEMTQLANTIVRKVNTRTVETIEAAVTAAEIDVIAGNSWAAFQTEGSTPTARRAQPIGDFAKVQTLAEADELGVVFNLWLINPNQWEALKIGYADDLPGVLTAAGIDIFPTNRVAAGTAYAVATGAVGFLEYEKPLQTETWRENALRRTWVQSFVMPLMGITQPRAVRKIVALA